MKGKSGLVLAVVALLAAFLVAAPVAHAGAIVVGDPDWYEFRFFGPGTFADTCPTGICAQSSGGNSQNADTPPWTWTGTTKLTVVDAFLSVDQFEIYDFGFLIGTTSAPTPGADPAVSDPVLALLDPDYSRGFFFGTGSHSLTIKQIAGVGGAGYFRVDAVPEPGTILLLGSGLLGLAAYRRKRK